MLTPLRVLILEDRPADAELMALELQRGGFDPDWRRVDTEADYCACLDQDPLPDVILSDYRLPDFDGLRALHLLQQRRLDIPFIVVTGSISEEVAVECMKQGADDYLLKDRLARLEPAVTQALQAKKLGDEKRQANRALRQREAILEAISFAAERFLRATFLEGTIQPVLERLGQATGVSRVYIFENHMAEDGALLTSLRYEWVAPGITPQIDNPELQDFPCLDGGFARWVEMLSQSISLYGHVREFPESEQEVLAAQDIRSIMVVPIFVEQAWWGFIGFDECLAEREWSAPEIEVLRTAADILGAAIQGKRAEEVLRQAEEKYRRIFENAVVGIYQTTLEGHYLMANPTLARTFGYESPEALLQAVTDLNRQFYVEPGQRAEFIRRVQEQGSVSDFKSQVYRQDGSMIWISENARAVRDASGQLVGFEGTTVDITDRKRAEESQERLAAAIEATSDVVAIAALDGRPLYLNKVGKEMLGVGEDEDISSIKISDAHPKWAGELVLNEGIPTALRDGIWRGETALLTRDGREIPVLQVIVAPRRPDGSVDFHATIMRDITRRKQMEEALRENEQRLSSIYNTVGDVIFHLAVETEGQYRFISVNPSFCRVTGLSQEQIVGKTVTEVIPEPSLTMVLGKYRQAIEAKTIVRWEETSDYPTGRLTGEVSIAPVFDDKGRCTHLVGSVHDITERKRTEEALRTERGLFIGGPTVVFKWKAQEGWPVEYVSPNVTSQFGYNPDDLTSGKIRYAAIIHPDDLARVGGEVTAYSQAGVAYFEQEYRITRADGQYRWLYDFTVVIRDSHGAITHYLGYVADITDRKMAEEEIQRENDIRTTLNTLLRLSLEDVSLDEILKLALDLVLSIPWLAFQLRGSIALVEDTPDVLVMKAQNNLAGPIQKACARVSFGKCLCGRAALMKEVQFADCLDDRHETRYEGITPHGNYCVPILSAGKTLGVINVYLSEGHRRDSQEETFLESVADSLAGVINRKRAEEQLRKLSHAVEQSPASVVITDTGGNIEYVNPRFTENTGYTFTEVVGKNPRILKSGITPPEVYQQLWQTINAGGIWRGELCNQKKSGENFWESTSIAPVTDPSGHITHFVAVKEDITERRQRERELQAITTVSATLRIAQTRAEMLPLILDQLCNLLKPDSAALAVRDPATRETVMELARGTAAAYSGACITPDQSVTGRTIATGKLYVNDDVRNDPELFQPDLLGNIRAVACVPLITNVQTIGAISIAREEKNGVQPPGFTESEMRLLTAIADMVANAIQRATLHEQTERRLQHIQALHEIDRAISASLDLRIILNVVLMQAVAQLRVDAAAVLLLSPYTQTLEFTAGGGFRTKAIERSRLRIGEDYAGQAALERRIVTISDLQETGSAFVRAQMLVGEAFVSYCAAPLIVKGQIKGVLETFHRAQLNPDAEWYEFLETLAGQIAIAIDNLSLFEGLQRSNAELGLAYDATIEGWSHALDLRDKETEGHTQRVTEITVNLARAMGMSEVELMHVRRGALLHDIGKMGVPDGILLKTGPLTDDEWVIMRKHPVYAYEMLSPIVYLRPALDIPYCHHEKWDGTGYPQGLKGEQIPLAARLFAIVDVWDALRSDRPYREAWPEEKVLEHIRAQAGMHFDPKVVELFLKMMNERTEEH